MNHFSFFANNFDPIFVQFVHVTQIFMFLAILLCIKWSRACLLTKDIFSWQSFPPLNPKCSRNYVWVHFYYCARHKFNLHFRECPRFFMFPLSLTKIGDKFHILQCWYLFWIRDIWEVLKILGRQICFLGFLRKNRKNSDSWLQTPVTDGEYWKF